MQQWPSSQRVSQEIFPPSDNHINVKADDLFFTVHIKRGTLVVQQCFSLVLWNKLHMQGICSDWNMIKIKARGHESTSADRKPMNVKRTTAADALSGSAHWLSSCLVCSHCAPSFFSLSPSQQYWRHVPLWSPYLLGHQSFPLNTESLDLLPQFIFRNPLLHIATNIHDVCAFVSEKSDFCSQMSQGFIKTSSRLRKYGGKPSNFRYRTDKTELLGRWSRDWKVDWMDKAGNSPHYLAGSSAWLTKHNINCT